MPRRSAILEFIILAVIVAYFTITAAVLAARAEVPHFDYFEFREVAESFSSGQVPAGFKRAPLYPALMALGAAFFPGADPFLTPARAISLAAAPVALVLAYVFAGPVLGRWRLVAVAWFGSASVFVLYAAQPICDMLFTALILAAFVAAGRGYVGYLFAGLAAATRYEAALLVLIMLILDFHRRRRWKAVVFGGLALVPVGGWLLLSTVKAGPGHHYFVEYFRYTPAALPFLKNAAATLLSFRAPALNILTYFGGVVALAGALYAAVRWRGNYRVAAAFFIVYLIIHVLYPWPFRRFVLPVLAVAVVGLWLGVREVVRAAFRIRWLAYALGAAGLFAGAALAVGAVVYVAGGTEGHAVNTIGPTLLLAAAVAYGALARPLSWYGRAAAFIFLVVGSSYVSKSVVVLRDDFQIEQFGITYKLAAEFLTEESEAGARVAAPMPALLEYYLSSPASRRRVVGINGLNAGDLGELALKLKRRNVRYLIAGTITCHVPENCPHEPPSYRLLLPLYEKRAGPPYRLVKEIDTKYESVCVYELE